MTKSGGGDEAIYQSSPEVAPDSEFEPGSLRRLVPGNSGRMLDARRTPVSVIEVRVETGFVALRVDAFEDAGAIWEVPLEKVGHYQFAHGSSTATDAAIKEMQAAIERFDRETVIEADPEARRHTAESIVELQDGADDWLSEHSQFLEEKRRLPDVETRHGDGELAADLEAYMRERGLWDIERAFASQYVSSPYSGEVVKGHQMVIAELGLVSYSGPIVHDPAALSGDWDRERRADHIRTRLAFLRALFARLAIDHVVLWRGLAADEPLRLDRRRTFVSTSFSEIVARNLFESGADRPTRVLMSQSVPIERLFMTYLETAAMNDRFLEAEAVLLTHPDDGWR